MISGRRAVFSAVVTSALNFLSIFIGFALHALLSKKFGTHAEMDAFVVAGTLPYLIPTVFMMAFHSSFIPLYHEYKKEAGEKKAWEMGQMFFLTFCILLVIFTVLGFSHIEGLVRMIAPGFKGKTFLMTIKLSRIMFPLLVFMGVTGMLNSLQISNFSFFRPAAAPLANMLVNISVVWIYESKLGIYSAAYGSLAGGVAQCILMLPTLFRGRLKFKIDLKHPKFKKCLYLMFPLLLAQVFGKSDQLIERYIASQLSAGSISYLSYAYRMLNNFISLIGTSIAVVSLPILSDIGNDKEKMGKTISQIMKLWLLIVTPMIASLLFYRIPIIQMLYQRGEFTYASTVNTASALIAYTGAFIITMGIGGNTLYALQKTKFFLYLCVITAAINAVSAVILTKFFGFLGPAMAYSIKIILSNIVCFIYFYHLGIKMDRFLIGLAVKVLAANTVAMYASSKLIPIFTSLCSNISSNTILLGSYLALGFSSFVAIYALSITIMDTQSVKSIYTLVRKK